MKHLYRTAFFWQIAGIIWSICVIVAFLWPGLSEPQQFSLTNQMITGMMMTCTGSLIHAIAKAAEHLKS